MPYSLVDSISKSSKAHWSSLAKANQSRGLLLQAWKPPPPDWIKVSVDASFADGKVVTGMVFRNHNHDSFMFAATYKEACLDPLSAECLAILNTCKELEKAKIINAIVESDSLNAISVINVDSKNKFWTAAPIFVKIKSFKSVWPSWDFRYISRNVNGAAHALAHWAFD
ncbi:hypothetical protein CASFOL_034564 [Castilleja foliolosa]|uniref:RNase H type-1 domain-containing protein n=1 Tax=Castilleja foliolosa TaxID=1961234 RepID=A0ABD3BSF7_9LAMI